MRLSVFTFAVVVCLVVAPDAQAQYANRSLGVGVQATASINNNALWGLTLDGSLYIENGFEVFLRVPILIADTATGAGTPSGRGQIFGTGGSLGVRYLFLEEHVRPYVGLQLSGLVLFTQPDPNVSFGPGAT